MGTVKRATYRGNAVHGHGARKRVRFARDMRGGRKVAQRVASVRPYRRAYRNKTALRIIMEQPLVDFDFWSGARQRVDELTYEDLQNLEYAIEDLYPDGLTATELNDMFWFDEDFIAQCLGYDDWEDMELQRRTAMRHASHRRASVDDWFWNFDGWMREFSNGALGYIEDLGSISDGEDVGYEAWVFEGGIFGEGDAYIGWFRTPEEAMTMCDGYGKTVAMRRNARRARFVRSAKRRFMRNAMRKRAAYGYFSDEAVDSIFDEFSGYFYDALGRDWVDALDNAESEGGIQYWQDTAYEYMDTALGNVLDEGNNAISRVIDEEAQSAADYFRDDIASQIEDWATSYIEDEIADAYLDEYGSGDEVSRGEIAEAVSDRVYELGVDILDIDEDSIVSGIVKALGMSEVVVTGRRHAMRKFASSYVDDVKGHVIDWLYDHEGESYYASDLATEITMNENYDGCWIPSFPEAMQFISDNWAYASDTFDYYKVNLDMAINPFENPAAYTFYMLDFGVGSIISQCPYIDEHWDDEIVLTPDVIGAICQQVNGVQRVAKGSRKMRTAMRRSGKRFARRAAMRVRRR